LAVPAGEFPGRHKDAERFASRALALDQSSDASYYNYGLILKKPEPAGPSHQSVHPGNWPSMPTFRRAGTTAARRSTTSGSTEKRHFRLRPSDRHRATPNAEAHFNKGNSLFQLKRHADAFPGLRSCFEAQPHDRIAPWGCDFWRRQTICDWNDYDTDCASLTQSLQRSKRSHVNRSFFPRRVAFTRRAASLRAKNG